LNRFPGTGTSRSEPWHGSPGGGRRLLVGRTDGGRVLTLVIEQTAGLERIAGARGKKPGEVVAELLREADRSAA
jgi:hypothetical protein